MTNGTEDSRFTALTRLRCVSSCIEFVWFSAESDAGGMQGAAAGAGGANCGRPDSGAHRQRRGRPLLAPHRPARRHLPLCPPSRWADGDLVRSQQHTLDRTLPVEIRRKWSSWLPVAVRGTRCEAQCGRQRRRLFAAAGEEYLRNTKALLLRANLQKHNFVQTSGGPGRGGSGGAAGNSMGGGGAGSRFAPVLADRI